MARGERPLLLALSLLCRLRTAPADEPTTASSYHIEQECAADACTSQVGAPKVLRLEPSRGVVGGGTRVVVHGRNFKNYGELMGCRFGDQESTASLTAPSGVYVNEYNHSMLACQAPAAALGNEGVVPVEITLDSDEYTSDGVTWSYYSQPALAGIAPDRGSASTSQLLTITRDADASTSAWTPPGAATCRFETVVDPDGRRQVANTTEARGTVVDATQVQCASPIVGFVGLANVEVALNGVDFSSGGLTFRFEDHWHSPPQSGMLPTKRCCMGLHTMGSDIYMFGGEDGRFESGGFTNDFSVLHTNAMSPDFSRSVPSASATGASVDLTWQTLTHTSGALPSPRSRLPLQGWGGLLLAVGGLETFHGASFNSTFEYALGGQAWREVGAAGGKLPARSEHRAVVCSMAAGCRTHDGRPRLFLFGGWALEDCVGQQRMCYRQRDDLWALDLNNMSWSEVEVDTTQPLPLKRKGHSATLFNGSQLLVFGGLAWAPDPAADNSYGATATAVNDAWRLDLSGDDGFTWHECYTVGDAPSPREGHAAAMLDDRYLVVHGGYAYAEGAPGMLGDTCAERH